MRLYTDVSRLEKSVKMTKSPKPCGLGDFMVSFVNKKDSVPPRPQTRASLLVCGAQTYLQGKNPMWVKSISAEYFASPHWHGRAVQRLIYQDNLRSPQWLPPSPIKRSQVLKLPRDDDRSI